MKTYITVEELYFRLRAEGAVEIPILRDVVPYLSRQPGITGKVLAKALDVKQGALSNAILLLTGVTLKDMQTQWKLLHAMYLLKNTTIDYKSVATQCGFKTINGLSKFMERQIGCTAYEYREIRTHGNRQT